MNIIRSSIKSQILDLKTLLIFSPLKRGVKRVPVAKHVFPEPLLVLNAQLMEN